MHVMITENSDLDWSADSLPVQTELVTVETPDRVITQPELLSVEEKKKEEEIVGVVPSDEIRRSQAYSSVSIYDEPNTACRPTMEDEFRVVPRLQVEGERVISYFGVYDGHGGKKSWG